MLTEQAGLWRSKKDDNAIWYTIHAAPQLIRYIVEKGSVTIDGISLTVAKVAEDNFSISAIPHTVSQTVLKDRKVGAVVNLETDIIGKYVEKLLFKGQSEGITEEMTGAQTIKENVPHKSGKKKTTGWNNKRFPGKIRLFNIKARVLCGFANVRGLNG